MMEARTQVEAAVRMAQDAVNESTATDARRKLEEAIRQEGDLVRRLAEGRETGTVSDQPLRPGQRVRMQSGGTGRVMELRDDGKVLVAAGSVKLVLAREELTELADEVSGAGSRASPAPLHLAPSTLHRNEVDLRGMRVDEAEAATLTALDRAVLDDLPYLRIIHGMGTGALKEVVRQLLSADRRVSGFAAAPQNQGGAGVTIAELAP
jgi:DNA mismatch repair protein MutS2